MKVLGVDAARGRWLAVLLEDSNCVGRFVRASVREIAEEWPDAAAIGIDIPIGEPSSYPREADIEARKFVGARGSSVFPTPHRKALTAKTYQEALELSRAELGKGLSLQSYGLRHRILEVEAIAAQDERVFEVHPEVSFRELAGHELASKRNLEGARQRLEALAVAGIEIPSPIDDDILDAAVAAWSADRYARGLALSLPEYHLERIGAIWR